MSEVTYPPSPRPAEAPEGNGMAIAGLVFGILMCVPLFSVLAIVFSAIGMARAKKRNGAGMGLSIAGLVLGIIGTLLIPLNFAILLPALNRAREQANRVKCASNMKQIELALAMYANSNQGAFPPSLNALVQSGTISAAELSCPSDSSGAAGNYVLVSRNPSGMSSDIVLFEPLSNHRDGIDILHSNGSVEFLRNPQAQAVITGLQNGINPSSAPGLPGAAPPGTPPQ